MERGGGLCPCSSTGITPVQYNEMGEGGGAKPTRLDGSTCMVQTYTNSVGARVRNDIDL